MNDYASATAYLRQLKANGVALGLERMRSLVAAIGNPQDRVPCIHIAGTNGKGSVAAMLEAALRGAGWKTGLYTSPHLVRLGERVQVNRVPLSEQALVGEVEELRRAVGARGTGPAAPTYFEFMTALAFAHFARCRCDVAVIETGLGGRLDATNVVTPEVSVITSVGLDHCEVLGNTLEAIAAEKAGIIKPSRPVAIGRLPPEAEAVVRTAAIRAASPVRSVREEFGDETARYPATNLAGRHQRWNAGTAVLAAGLLEEKWRLSKTGIERALLEVEWPARWQTLSVDRRTVIVDASHNPEGAAALADALQQLVGQAGKGPVVVVGALGRARASALLEVIARFAREIHLVVPHQSRACSTAELSALIPGHYQGRIVRSDVEAIFPAPLRCTVGEAGEHVVVTGSIYLAGEVLARLQPERGPLESDLQDF